ncbi:MAG: DNA adenine methylase [Planctomycetes bacterium]|nr:DNA adenine methylase [Planctomycetota bacterium]
MRTLWYMGAKTRLTDSIAAAVASASPRGRAVCDLMSGTASVSTALCGRYRVLANDVQAYAQAVAAAYLEHDRASRRVLETLDPEADLGAAYRRNRDALLSQLGPAAAVEDAFLRASGLEVAARDRQEDPNQAGLFLAPELPPARRRLPVDAQLRAGAYRTFALQSTPTFCEANDARPSGPFRDAAGLFERGAIMARRAAPSTFPYHLCSSYYPNVYLGLRQAVDLDSLRYAIDQLSGRGAAAKRRHYLAALLHAASVTTSATSHFCQPRGLVRDAEVLAVLQRRSVSIPSRVLAFSHAIRTTCRQTDPHEGSRASCADWRTLYASGALDLIDVVYADPPYTADNYSRFYHVLEVLTRYDYPELQVSRGKTTKGRYPVIGERHQSPFCHRRGVDAELRALCQETAARGASLVLSYAQENGLWFKVQTERGASPAEAREGFLDLARAAYRDVRLETRGLLHSGQGDSNHQVTELLLVARKPR